MKSKFKSDLSKEKALHPLLDAHYAKLKQYRFDRVADNRLQRQGVDVIAIRKATSERFYIDEKAQLDYINQDLPTFAFEIRYVLGRQQKMGWLFDPHKKTDFYALATTIFSDEGNRYTSCNVLLVNRKKLLGLLAAKNILHDNLCNTIDANKIENGMVPIPELNVKTEGYLFLSSKNKAEKPLNLILRLQWLLDVKVAKRV